MNLSKIESASIGVFLGPCVACFFCGREVEPKRYWTHLILYIPSLFSQSLEIGYLGLSTTQVMLFGAGCHFIEVCYALRYNKNRSLWF